MSIDKADRRVTAKRVEKSEALTMMASAFEGKPSKEAIKAGGHLNTMLGEFI